MLKLKKKESKLKKKKKGKSGDIVLRISSGNCWEVFANTQNLKTTASQDDQSNDQVIMRLYKKKKTKKSPPPFAINGHTVTTHTNLVQWLFFF